MSEANFEMLLHIAADSPAELRKCDVYRIVEASENAGCMLAFCRWLAGERPDLADEVAECAGEVNGWASQRGKQ